MQTRPHGSKRPGRGRGGKPLPKTPGAKEGDLPKKKKKVRRLPDSIALKVSFSRFLFSPRDPVVFAPKNLTLAVNFSIDGESFFPRSCLGMAVIRDAREMLGFDVFMARRSFVANGCFSSFRFELCSCEITRHHAAAAVDGAMRGVDKMP
nr:hypothetical protein CFP56_01384 [Quercus suber]